MTPTQKAQFIKDNWLKFKTVRELATAGGMTTQEASYMVFKLRKHGFNLPPRHKRDEVEWEKII